MPSLLNRSTERRSLVSGVSRCCLHRRLHAKCRHCTFTVSTLLYALAVCYPFVPQLSLQQKHPRVPFKRLFSERRMDDALTVFDRMYKGEKQAQRERAGKYVCKTGYYVRVHI